MAPLNGYPTIVGDHKLSVFPHTGPASYTRVTAGPLAGGDTVRAREAGMTFFDKVENGVSDSGQFSVEAFPLVGNPSSSPRGAASASYGLRWIARFTATIGGQAQTAGVEAATATDLSTQIVRLSAHSRI